MERVRRESMGRGAKSCGRSQRKLAPDCATAAGELSIRKRRHGDPAAIRRSAAEKFYLDSAKIGLSKTLTKGPNFS
jgi:hypothetical protein